MDYSHVLDHPFNPNTVRVWDKLFLASNLGFVEVTYLDGPVTLRNAEHFVRLPNGEPYLVDGQKLFEAPLGYIEQTAVYRGDRVRGILGHEYLIAAVDCRGGFVLRPFHDLLSCVTLAGDLLTLSKPREKRVGYVALTPVYGIAPSELHASVTAQPHVFADSKEAARLYPNAAIVTVEWYDNDVSLHGWRSF